MVQTGMFAWARYAIPAIGMLMMNSTVLSQTTSGKPVGNAEREQQRRLTLRFQDTPIQEALHRVAKQGGLALSWSKNQVPLQGTVTATFERAALGDVVATLLRGRNATFELSSDGGTILIVRKDTTVQSEKTPTNAVQGQVTDSATGKGIGGITVMVEGTALRATTDARGQYVLQGVPIGNQKIIARGLGYRTTSRVTLVAETGRQVVSFALVQTTNVLSNVVTTATGTQRRVEVPNDVTVLNIDSLMKVAPVRSVTDLLATRVPGLQVQRTSGVPGDPSRLRIRGTSSVNSSNAPIVIVDGMRVFSPDSSENGATSVMAGRYAKPSPLDQIDPNTIETIEVFKGPSASSLYGSDAANGVIVITTKRGHPGQTRLATMLTSGTSSIPGRFPENRFMFGRALNNASQICDFYSRCTIDSVVMFQALNDRRYSPLGRASTGSASSTVSGGSQTIQYSFTGSAQTQNGLTRLPGIVADLFREAAGKSPPAWMRRPDRYTMFNGSSSFVVALHPAVQLTTNHLVAWSEQQRSSLSATMGAQLLEEYIDPTYITLADQGNQVLYGYQERVRATSLSSQHNMALRWQVRPTIPLHLRAGLNPSSLKDITAVPSGLPEELDVTTKGAYSNAQGNVLMGTVGGNTTVPLQFADGTRLDLALGSELVYRQQTSQGISTTHLPEGITEPGSFLPEFTTTSRTQSATSTYGMFLEPRFTIASRVFVQTGLRLDGGSASGNRAGLTRYPKLGLSWLAIENGSNGNSGNFNVLSQLISQLRVRTGFGLAGVQPGPTQHMRLLGPLVQSTDGGQTTAPGYNFVSAGNTRLRPERATELEGGVDLDLLQQRILLSTTLYWKRQRDAIMPVGVARSVGMSDRASEQFVNIGDIRNTGYELTLNARVLETRLVNWSVNMALNHRTNELTRKSDGLADQKGALAGDKKSINYFGFVVGYPVYGYWASPIVGYADQSGDGILQYDEIVLGDSAVYRGSNDPGYTATFNTNLSLLNGRLTLAAAFDYQHGLTQFNTNAIGALMSAANRENATLLDQAVALVSATYPGTPYYMIQNVNTLRFQSFSLGYTLPASITTALKMRQATVFLQGSNLGLRTGYRGIDPNVNAYASGNLSADRGQLPAAREWQLRVNLSR